MDLFIDRRGKAARLSLVVMLLGVTAIVLVACGGSEVTPTPTVDVTTINVATPTSQAGTPSSGATSEVQATLAEWSINLNVDQVNAGTVKFTVANTGTMQHDLVVLDSSNNQVGATPAFAPTDGSKELVVDLKPGTYTIICDLPGHAAKGMKTTLT